jgi:hypothetical protein
MTNTFRFLTPIIAGGCLLIAATSSIGVIRSSGEFRLDGSIVRGNSTVFDGNLLETTTTRSVVQLDAGQVTLAPQSRAKVYHDRTVLEKGAGLLRDAAGKHEFEAASLHIVPTARDSVIQVDIQGQGRIAVAARDGEAQVRNSSGVLVASLRAGMELAFDMQAGASKAVKIAGVLEQRSGNYFIADTTTHVTFQIQGNSLAQYVGKKVEIAGSLIPGATPAAGATQVVQAAGIQLAPVAAGGTAAGTAAAGAHWGTIAIVGGVAVGGTVVGLVSAGTFSGGSSTSAP